MCITRITSTPVGALLVYPKAFSVLMAPEGDQPQDHAVLLDAVRHGDILLFNCWYKGDEGRRPKNCTKKRAPFRTAIVECCDKTDDFRDRAFAVKRQHAKVS
jgi:hypothetical protein